jgi:glutaminyl-tRNA synthetase
VKATLHWVSAAHAVSAEVRLYDRLFSVENPAESENYLERLNPSSLEVLDSCKVEPRLAAAAAGYFCQFERIGYFSVDPDSRPNRLVFNRTVGLRDAWSKIEEKLKTF